MQFKINQSIRRINLINFEKLYKNSNDPEDIQMELIYEEILNQFEL